VITLYSMHGAPKIHRWFEWQLLADNEHWWTDGKTDIWNYREYLTSNNRVRIESEGCKILELI